LKLATLHQALTEEHLFLSIMGNAVREAAPLQVSTYTS